MPKSFISLALSGYDFECVRTYWLHQDLSQPLDYKLEIFGSMQSTQRFPELVWSVIRNWVRNQHKQQLETVRNQRLLGVHGHAAHIDGERPRILIVLENLDYAAVSIYRGPIDIGLSKEKVPPVY